MEPLDPGDLLKRSGYLREALDLRNLPKVGIERHPLHLLSGCRLLEISFRILYDAGRIRCRYLGLAAFQMFKEYLSV